MADLGTINTRVGGNVYKLADGIIGPRFKLWLPTTYSNLVLKVGGHRLLKNLFTTYKRNSYNSSIYDFPETTGCSNYSNLQRRHLICTWDGLYSVSVDSTGEIHGTVKVEGVLWPEARVSLYYVKTGTYISSCFTDELGQYHFYGLEVGNPLYFVVAHHPDFGMAQADYVRPVNHQGIIPPPYVAPDPWVPAGVVEWTPADDLMDMWWDFTDATSLNIVDSALYQVTDKSGHGRTGSQNTPANRGSIDNGLVFDEDDEYIPVVSPLRTQQSLFIVFSTTDNTFVAFAASGNSAEYCLTGQEGDFVTPLSGGSFTSLGSVVHKVNDNIVLTNRNHAWSLLSNTGDNIVEISNITPPNNFSLSGYEWYNYPPYSLQGNIKEVIVYKGTPSDDVRSLITGYLAWKHGIGSKLPAGHKFVSSIPSVDDIISCWNMTSPYNTLDLDNRRITQNTSSTHSSSATKKDSGDRNVYFEMLTGPVAGSNRFGIGFRNNNSIATNLGTDVNSWAAFGYDGSLWTSNVQVGSIGSFGINTVIGVAYNPTVAMVFYRINGTWVNSGNPVTLTNSTFSGVTGAIRPSTWLYDLNTSLTLKTRASDLTYSIPTGYEAFDLS